MRVNLVNYMHIVKESAKGALHTFTLASYVCEGD